LGVGYSQEISFALAGSLPAGDYLATVEGTTAKPGTEIVHVALQVRPITGDQLLLGEGDATLATTGTPPSATTTLTLPAGAYAAHCGDELVVVATHPSGTQNLFPFQISLDIP
jgi:hypothetical protein